MKFESLISPETIQAYRETEFRVFVSDVVVLKISEKSDDLTHVFIATESIAVRHLDHTKR